MSVKKRIILPPKDIVNKPHSVAHYIATVDYWLTFRIMSDVFLEELDSTTLKGIQYFDQDRRPYNYPPYYEDFHMYKCPQYISKITMQGPTALSFIKMDELEKQKSYINKIWWGRLIPNVRPTRVDIAKDFICHNERDAVEFMRFINSSIYKKYRRNQSVQIATGKAGNDFETEDKPESDVTIEKYDEKPTEYEDEEEWNDEGQNEVRYTGRSQVPNKIVTYYDDACLTTNGPAAHMEWRVIGHQALKRAKIESTRALLNLDCREFWEPRFLLKGIDYKTKVRIGKVVLGETGSRKPHSGRYSFRITTALSSALIDYLSSYYKIGNGFVRGSFKLYRGEVYLDVQDVIDRMKRYGVISSNISQHFPDIDVSEFDQLPEDVSLYDQLPEDE